MALPKCMQDKVRLPVIGAPMYILSGPKLVLEQCKAGIVGAMPALNARPSSLLDEWFAAMKEELEAYKTANPDKTVAPFAVNLIVHKSNATMDVQLDMIVKHKIPLVITGLGAVPEVNDAIHSYGGEVLHDVIHARHAEKALEGGADGLVAVTSGAGGHSGQLSAFGLVQEIREFHNGPLILSGSVSTGDGILAAQALGADGVSIGSAFIASDEANAVEPYKDAIVSCAARDIVGSDFFTGVWGNYLAPSIINSGYDPANLPKGDAKSATFDTKGENVKAWRDIWGAGQGIGAIKTRQPAAHYINKLADEYETALARLGRSTGRFSIEDEIPAAAQ